MSQLVKQAREMARGAGMRFSGSTDERVGPPVVLLSGAVIALADALESHLALHDAPNEESAAQKYSSAILDVLLDFGCAPPEGLHLESQVKWLREQLAELKAARSCVEILRTCVRDDIVVVEAVYAVNAYDAACAVPPAEGPG